MALVELNNTGAYPQAVAGFWRSGTSLAVANNTEVRVTYSTLGFNHGGIVDSANSRFLIPSNGIYLIHFKAVFASNSSGIRGLEIWETPNGGGAAQLDWYINQQAVNGEAHEMMAPHITELVTGDEVYFKLWQTSGSSLNTFSELYCVKLAAF